MAPRRRERAHRELSMIRDARDYTAGLRSAAPVVSLLAARGFHSSGESNTRTM